MVSSGFVPVGSFSSWLQGFAKYQPFTPIINTLRGLLAGTPQTGVVAWAIGWTFAIALSAWRLTSAA
jgi:ABC-2 type transport system permease protein